MTLLIQRRWLGQCKPLRSVAAVTVAVLALTACSPKEEAAAPQAGAPAADTSAPLQVGFMYVSPIGDGG